MVMIAKKYMPQNTMGVDIKIADAVEYVQRLPGKRAFDLALVDIYLGGDKQPQNAKDIEFLLKLKEISRNVIVNQLIAPHSTDRMKKVEFLRELSEHFKVEATKVDFNVMISY